MLTRLRILVLGVISIVAILLTVWSGLAIWIDARLGQLSRILLLVLVFCVTLGSLHQFRFHWKGLIWPASLFLTTLCWWLSLKPSHHRNWEPQYEKLCTVERESQILVFRNVRNFDFFSFDSPPPAWETRTYDLNEIEGMHIYFSFWGPRFIAHTILVWDFKSGPPLAISIETRREKGEPFSGLRGFFRQFELIYVVGDELDLVASRTHRKSEDVYLYRLQASKELSQELLLEYVRQINDLSERPRWYNAASQNCTTLIRDHLQTTVGEQTWTWRLLLNGYLPGLAHSRGTFSNDLSFQEFQERSRVSDKALAVKERDLFSEELRRDLP